MIKQQENSIRCQDLLGLFAIARCQNHQIGKLLDIMVDYGLRKSEGNTLTGKILADEIRAMGYGYMNAYTKYRIPIDEIKDDLKTSGISSVLSFTGLKSKYD